VQTLAVEEDLGVIEDGGGELLARQPTIPIEQFDLQGGEEALSHSVIYSWLQRQ